MQKTDSVIVLARLHIMQALSWQEMLSRNDEQVHMGFGKPVIEHETLREKEEDMGCQAHRYCMDILTVTVGTDRLLCRE